MSQWNPSLFSSLGPLTMTVQSEQRELQWQQPHPIVWPSLQHGISVQRAEGGDYCVLTSKEVCLTWVWRCATRVSPWSSLAILISPPQTPFAATKLAAAHTEAGMAMHGQTYEHTQAPSSTHGNTHTCIHISRICSAVRVCVCLFQPLSRAQPGSLNIWCGLNDYPRTGAHKQKLLPLHFWQLSDKVLQCE